MFFMSCFDLADSTINSLEESGLFAFLGFASSKMTGICTTYAKGADSALAIETPSSSLFVPT